MVNFFDTDKFEESWRNFGNVAYGLALYAEKPLDAIFDQTSLRDRDNEHQTRAKAAARQFGKSLVAWDEWEKNPSRAAGTVAFNAITLGAGALPKAGIAGKAGLATRTASVIGKTGELLDAGTYVGKGAQLGLKATKAALPRVSEVATEVQKSLGKLTERAGAIEYIGHDGKTFYLDRHGNLRDADFKKTDPIENAEKEPHKDDLPNHREHVHTDDHAFAHAGADGPSSAHGHGAGSSGHDVPGSGRGHAAGNHHLSDGATGAHGHSTQGPRGETGAGSHGNGHPGEAPYSHTGSESPAAEFPGEGQTAYADPPESPKAAQVYEEFRGRDDDTRNIAEHTGFSQTLLDRVKAHLFEKSHHVERGPGRVSTGRFAPMDHIADLWTKADAGTLTKDEMVRFRRLIAHEGVESQLMAEGVSYRSAHPDAWDEDGVYWGSQEHHGAHDVAPNEHHPDPFRAWGRLGLERPAFEIAEDLSNLDDVTNILRKWFK
ncbi:hypothetical protein [Streptomyces sp. NPDC049585]|uniref:hypothetical protein n=1 Tax=Streptomyces sp. NPDC049585 TaxID=3155154 RepID=UPI0034434CFC